MKKKIRTGKVFVDWSQNDEHKTTIAGVLAAGARTPDSFDSGDLGRSRALSPKRKMQACWS